MSLILVVDDSSLCCDLLTLALQGHGYSASFCGLGTAKARIDELKPAILIIDAAGSGMGLLQLLRSGEPHKNLPVIILTEQTGREAVVLAASLGVRDYMLKSRFSFAELLMRVRKYVLPEKPSGISFSPAPTRIPVVQPEAAKSEKAISSVSADSDQAIVHREAEKLGIPLLTRKDMLVRLDGAKIKTLPGAVAELLALVNSPRGTMQDVAHSLRRDPVLSSRVLRVANSAAFASQRARIPTVEEAVKHIGMAAVRNLITTVGVYETFSAGTAGETMVQSWQHSLAVAGLMEKLTPEDDSNPPGVAYVVGLCHDLCGIILQQYFAEEYTHVIKLAHNTGRLPRHVEAVVFGLSHSELASLVLSRLGLPGVVTAPIQEFFERGTHAQSPGAGSLLGRTLRMVNVYAHGLMLASAPDEPVLPFSKAECRQTFGDKTPSIDNELVRAEAVTTAAILAGLSAAETAQAAEPPIPMRKLQICYVRHDEYAQFDPLHVLLKLTAERVDVLTRMPPKLESVGEADAMVVVMRRSPDPSETIAAIGQLTRVFHGTSFPVFVLTGSDRGKLGEIPAHFSVSRLPTSSQAWGEFQKSIQAPAAKFAA